MTVAAVVAFRGAVAFRGDRGAVAVCGDRGSKKDVLTSCIVAFLQF